MLDMMKSPPLLIQVFPTTILVTNFTALVPPEHEASSFDIPVYSLQFFTYEDAFETETNFSAIYKPDFMMKVLDLQQRIEALKTEGDF